MVGNHVWWQVVRQSKRPTQLPNDLRLLLLRFLFLGLRVMANMMTIMMTTGLSKAQSFPAFNQSEIYRTETYALTGLDVKIAKLDPREIRYQVTLPDGSSFELKTNYDLPARHFPNFQAIELKAEAEYYRATLEGFARLIQAGPAFDYAAMSGSEKKKLYTLELNQERLREKGLQAFDPLQATLRQISAQPASGGFSAQERIAIERVTFSLPTESSSPSPSEGPVQAEIETTLTPGKEPPQTMLKKAMQFLLDTMVISTKRAWNAHKSGEFEIRRNWDERGLQFGIKLEFMVGAGKLNLARSVSLSLSVGYNRQSRSLVFRRGFRMEKMSDGSNLSIGGKIELKQYRLNTSSAYGTSGGSGDHAKFSGQAWYPPMFMPVVSPVFETGRGYQSEGFSLAGNLADFGGSFLLNSVSAFEEAQRVYQAPLPDPNRWISDIVRRGEGFFVSHIGTLIPTTHSYTLLNSTFSRCDLAFTRVH